MRSRDRLAELQRAASLPGAASDPPAVASLPPELDALFLEVERMRGGLRRLQGATQRARRLHADPTFHTNQLLQEQLDATVAQAHAEAVQTCEALRQFEGRTRMHAAGGTSGVHARIARLQYAATRRLFADALGDHHRVLHALRDHRLQLLHHQLKLTNLTISEEECQELLESKNLYLFVDNLQAETAEARRALRDAESRREELARLERALRDVRDLFHHLALLVAQQQDQIDSVEYYALQATSLVEHGGRDLLRGTVGRRAQRQKKIGLVICLISGFLIVLVVLILT